MSNIERLTQIARAEIGVKESPANSDNVKYNTEYYGKPVNSTATTKYYWCVVFIWWLFKQAGLSELFYGGGKTASCTTLMNYAKQNGQWVTSGYKPGDLLIFTFNAKRTVQHIGFCISASGGRVTSIDGNTGADSSASQDNGGMVNLRTRNVSTVVGAYRPKYDSVTITGTLAAPTCGIVTVPVNAPILKKGSEHPAVKMLQAFLNNAGFNCGSVDGSFGSKTDAALRAFQQSAGLTVDGSCGAQTWSRILGV